MLNCLSVSITSLIQAILESIVHSPSSRSYVRNSELVVTATHGDIGMQLILKEIFEEIMLKIQPRRLNQRLSVKKPKNLVRARSTTYLAAAAKLLPMGQ